VLPALILVSSSVPSIVKPRAAVDSPEARAEPRLLDRRRTGGT
jgi:hypothetical protein